LQYLPISNLKPFLANFTKCPLEQGRKQDIILVDVSPSLPLLHFLPIFFPSFPFPSLFSLFLRRQLSIPLTPVRRGVS